MNDLCQISPKIWQGLRNALDRASGRSREKSQISQDFQGQIHGKKTGQLRGNFAGIFEASFAEKRLINNGRLRGRLPSKFRWKAIGFALICGKFSMKLDALIDLLRLHIWKRTRNKRIRILKTHLLILVASSSIFFIQLHVVCLTFNNFQIYCADMYLVRFLANFAGFRVFWWISRDFADLVEIHGSATVRNIRSPAKLSSVLQDSYLDGWPKTNTPCGNNFFFFSFPFESDIKDCRTLQPCVMSFLLFLNYLFLISPCLHSRVFIYNVL